jgi:hypothetical protein
MAIGSTSEPGKFTVVWSSTGQKAQKPSDQRYPRGVHIDGRMNKEDPSCIVKLPYPSPCVGAYKATCEICGLVIGITAAGRRDDPKSFEITCNLHGVKQ